MKLRYWKKYKHNKSVYSVDMIRLVFELREDALEDISKYLSSSVRTDITMYPKNLGLFKYRYLFTIQYTLSTMTIGIGLNSYSKEDRLKGFVEFNPNKIMEESEKDLHYLFSCCYSVEVKRWDLAIDIPVARYLVHIEKDKRKYELQMKSANNVTEYLGVRNEAGRVKLYNKTIESNLETDWTRLEITMDGIYSIRNQFVHFPVVWIDAYQMQMDLSNKENLDSTQKVLVECIKQSDNPLIYLKQLNYNLRKKISPYILSKDKMFKISEKNVLQLAQDLKIFER